MKKKVKGAIMKDIYHGKGKIIIVFGALFLTVSILLALIFFAGKKSYEVRFELNGGTLLSGSLEQRVTQGQDAIPPNVVKDGAYLRGWSESYKRVTKDIVVEAVWEYETTPGIVYATSENQNFAEVLSVYKYLKGEVYLGGYFNDKKVLGILDEAFAGCEEITKVYLLEGLISIGDRAFADCISLTEIEIPETVTRLGDGVLSGCTSLEKLVLHKGLQKIGADAFKGCSLLIEIEMPETVTRLEDGAFSGCTSLESVTLNEGLLEIGAGVFEDCIGLKEIVIPASVVKIDADAFANCEGLVIKTMIPIEEMPEGWENGWPGNAIVEWFEKTADEEPSTDGEEREIEDGGN